MGYQPDILNDIMKLLSISELKRLTKINWSDKMKIKEEIENRYEKLEKQKLYVEKI